MKQSTITAYFKSSIERGWDVVTDNRNFAWRSDLSRIEMVDSERFIEYTKSGFATHFRITSKEPCRYYAFDIDNQNMSGHWTGIFEEDGEGTKMIFTEEVQVKNPIMNLFVRGYLKKQQSTYAADLRKALDENVC